MWILKQCTCGSKEFEHEPDDDVIVCAECGCKARYEFIKESEAQGE